MPDRFDDLLTANERFAETFAAGDLAAPPRRHLAVLTCIDTRIDPLRALGLEIGDAKILRNAGARVTPDVLRSLAVAVHVLGVNAVAVVQHTQCGMAGRTDAELRDVLVQAGCDWPVDQPLLALDDADAALRDDVAALAGSPLLGGAVVAGMRYDVRTGRVQRLV